VLVCKTPADSMLRQGVFKMQRLSMENIKKRLIATVGALVISACAQVQLTIQSNPSGAEVDVKNKSIGQTPLTISAADFSKYVDGNFMNITVKKSGYVTKEVYLQPNGISNYNFDLDKVSGENLKAIPYEYSGLVHEITRDLLTIQGLIFANETDEAKNKLNEFEKLYPNVAAASTLNASIEILKGNYEGAYTYLMTAQKLDPNDLQVQKMLTEINAKNREPSSAK
jgi:hypothetical protein